MYKNKLIDKFVKKFNKTIYDDPLYKGRFVLQREHSEKRKLDSCMGYQHYFNIYDKETQNNISVRSPILFYNNGSDNYTEFETLLLRTIVEELKNIKINGTAKDSKDYR